MLSSKFILLGLLELSDTCEARISNGSRFDGGHHLIKKFFLSQVRFNKYLKSHLKIFVKLNLSIHVRINFAQDIVKFLAADVSITEALKKGKKLKHCVINF